VTGYGLTTHALVSDPTRPLHVQVDEAAEVIRLAAKLGTYDSVRVQHHWLSYPTVWLEPFPLLARWVPDAGEMRLMTSVMKPPIHNPVDLAHQVATMDQLCNGRFILGVGIGYQEDELETVGATRKQRVRRFEESLAIWPS
jgi:alkanesulfonate monooxygenase SsuD/methylene tetrahydromethanopterin reductase-like flavin-dependent oxidoreductase (luciferase family)